MKGLCHVISVKCFKLLGIWHHLGTQCTQSISKKLICLNSGKRQTCSTYDGCTDCPLIVLIKQNVQDKLLSYSDKSL